MNAQCKPPHQLRGRVVCRTLLNRCCTNGWSARSPVARARRGDPIWNETLMKWLAGETAFTHPGMESFNEIRDRTLRVLQQRAAGNSLLAGGSGASCVMVWCRKCCCFRCFKEHSVADWQRIGMAKNLSVSELVSGLGLLEGERTADCPASRFSR